MRTILLITGFVAAAQAASSAPLSPAPTPAPGWQMESLDPGCPACRDFYRFANGGWADHATIPEGRSAWSTYDEVDEWVRKDLEKIIAEGSAAAAAGQTGNLAKIGTFYSSCMDEARADREGSAPVADELKRIQAMRTTADVTSEIRRLNMVLPELLFWTDVGADPMNPSRSMLEFGQGGLSLPETSLYADSGKEGQEARETLRGTAAEMFRLSGMQEAAAATAADRVVAIETELARASKPPEALRDQKANYHPMTIAEANALTPHWDWPAYLQTIGAPADAPLEIGQPEYFAALDRMIAAHSPADWAAYFQWHVLRRASPWLSKPFREARQSFSRHFSGAKGTAPREVRCMDALNYGLGEALGDIYRQRHFPPEAERRAERMVANLKAAMADRINQATWMSPATRRKALKKLAAMNVYVGGPAKIRDYQSLPVVDGPFWTNMSAAYGATTRYVTGKLGKPTDRGDWYILPQTISGAADFERNAFYYPVGKFQPPFFDAGADDALNYGALGATMGHELTHLFDDRGRAHDETGRLRDWWNARDVAAYKARAKKVVDEFEGYRVGSERVKGALTVSENIADLGGLTIAYYALERELAGKPRTKIDGFTPEQRFFLAWARNFREVTTPEQLRRQVRSDEHAPSIARVNVPLSNMPEFQKAFGCKPGGPMYRAPKDRARIW
jgi:putative endopeptidase